MLVPTAATIPAARSMEPTEHADADTHVSPIARRLAEQLGVDLARIIGTGRNGRISKQDVEAFAARGTVPATPAQPDNANVGVRRIRISARRATIARRLLESKQTIPHFRLNSDVDFGPLLQLKRWCRE